MSSPAFQLPSFAKINWSLRILGRRADGYHEVRTVLQTISLQDELRFSALDSREVLLSCSDPRIPLGEANLIVQAGNSLRDQFNVQAGALIHLEKYIPAQAGLGGASSNAAIALLGLAHLWRLDISLLDLIGIASRLGADVPFFLIGGPVLASGTGTELKALDEREKKHLILISPNATVSTAAAYESLKAPALTTFSDASILSSSRADEVSEVSSLYALHNDFEDVIFSIEPEIARAKTALVRAGASAALMAGSGSTVFGIFDNKQEQEHALNKIQAEVGWRVFPAVTLSRHEYQASLGSCAVPLSV